MIAQITVILFMTISLALSINDHGKPRKPESGRMTLLSVLIWLVLLYWGGFFDVFFK